MDVKEAIGKGRSIRSYKDEDVPESMIKELIDAARLAPSGNNAQPWAFKIVKSREEKELLRKNKIFVQPFVYTAPLIIVCCTDPSAYPKEELIPGLDDRFELRAVRDLSIASQNIILRATELGLGTCYVGWMKKQDVKPLLGIPEKYMVIYVITAGYPAESPKPRPRKKMAEIILE
jgi:nitroreductase